ncbi:TolC family protein [Pedobacter sp. L105]|uniref:TolC family protein n=1 Tax=Pedobacter sp. L105 TaxID=1641871 RepID=UPI00131BCD5A|nr:TolC family protein [Pedobacter sp. L105]
MKKTHYSLFICLSLLLPHCVFSQDVKDSVVTLKQCVNFALQNQPAVKQAAIDQEINEKDIRIGLSAWLPQLNSSNLYQHYFQGSPLAASVATTGSSSPTTGSASTSSSSNLKEYSALGLQASQVIYNNEVLQAAKAAKYSRQYYKQNTYSSQINVVADVSKAFFDVLLSEKQLDILNADIVRLQRSLKDAQNRYQAGVTDKTDYKQATILLNNSTASRKQTAEAVKSKTAYLKQIMGISADHNLKLSYDSARYEQEAAIDTNQRLDVNNRIEYRLLETQKGLLNVNVSYYKWGFLPSVSAVGVYNLNYLSNKFSNLYNNAYPNSYAGLTLDIPIFTGTKRLQNLSKARLQVERNNYDIVNSANSINTEYVQSLADYKSNYTNWQLLKENVTLANDVYKVVSLQYREGIKTYLDVIVSQSDLRTAELNYYNALFQLLSSKIDLEKSLGILNVQYN